MAEGPDGNADMAAAASVKFLQHATSRHERLVRRDRISFRRLGKTAAGAARAVKSTFDDDPFEVLCYRGYGNSARAWIHGRVVEKLGIGASADADSTLRNLLNTYRRADSDPLRHARVSIDFAGKRTAMETDDDGFFGGHVEPAAPITSDDEWHSWDCVLDIPSVPDSNPVKGSGQILIAPATARVGIISDIDDTVIQSRVSNFLQAARTVMLGNARTRLPFPGVAAFYRALRDGASGDEKNPVFYVSSSPWNIFDVIAEFMDLQNIPKGPLLLRDWDIAFGSLSSSRHFDHKGVAIRNIMQTHPHLEFILIGDTSQHDPEIYRKIVGEFPDRILAIYIRDVSGNAERTASVGKLAEEILASHSSLVLSPDSLGAAKHAAAHGWIKADSLPEIGEEKRADEGTEGNKVATPGGGASTLESR